MTRSDTLDTIAILDEQQLNDPRTTDPDKKELSSDSLSSLDWKVFVHPQGSIYFSNGQIIADQDVRDPEILHGIQYGASLLDLDAWDLDGSDKEMEVQLNINNRKECSFTLFINHTHCIAAHAYEKARNEALGDMDPETLNRRRRLYWNFMWTHSAHRPCPARAIPDACDALAWFYADNLISGTGSVVPFSKTECEELLRRVKEFERVLRVFLPCYDNSSAKTSFLCWLLREICSFRNAEMYGQLTRGELTDRRQDQYTQHKAHSNSSARPANFILPVLHLIMNCIFFGIPHSYMRLVKQSFEYRGRLAGMQANWETYIDRLVREYSHFLLISTVLLSATVGLLAVPSVSRIVELAALVSAFSSLGSIIIGVFAIWRHQAKFRATDSFTYMRNAKHNLLGFYGHAMLLSLPPVLLVWAIIAFTISTLAYALDSLGGHDTGNRIVIGVILAIFVCILGTVIAALYTLTMIWTYQNEYWWTRLGRMLTKGILHQDKRENGRAVV
ncbi:hypothetical protein J3R30DRAFT_3307448 [Lentinula aciculospora]|uniref:Uncharacterized protein n=1 Tax=Lentinula aciculospora TaxID=153920 RepID=A0A9W8ZVM7_9AGAR|nr:hypothetical protein J3R30DRAFT_3307448 [Lentinula aciculospora]